MDFKVSLLSDCRPAPKLPIRLELSVVFWLGLLVVPILGAFSLRLIEYLNRRNKWSRARFEERPDPGFVACFLAALGGPLLALAYAVTLVFDCRLVSSGGHTANTIVWYGVVSTLVICLPVWYIRILPGGPSAEGAGKPCWDDIREL
jgi:hypothetical protein